jgi:hypothetical protein
MDGDAARLRGAAALVLHKALFRRTDLQQVEQQNPQRPGNELALA